MKAGPGSDGLFERRWDSSCRVAWGEEERIRENQATEPPILPRRRGSSAGQEHARLLKADALTSGALAKNPFTRPPPWTTERAPRLLLIRDARMQRKVLGEAS